MSGRSRPRAVVRRYRHPRRLARLVRRADSLLRPAPDSPGPVVSGTSRPPPSTTTVTGAALESARPAPGRRPPRRPLLPAEFLPRLRHRRHDQRAALADPAAVVADGRSSSGSAPGPRSAGLGGRSAAAGRWSARGRGLARLDRHDASAYPLTGAAGSGSPCWPALAVAAVRAGGVDPVVPVDRLVHRRRVEVEPSGGRAAGHRITGLRRPGFDGAVGGDRPDPASASAWASRGLSSGSCGGAAARCVGGWRAPLGRSQPVAPRETRRCG